MSLNEWDFNTCYSSENDELASSSSTIKLNFNQDPRLNRVHQKATSKQQDVIGMNMPQPTSASG